MQVRERNRREVEEKIKGMGDYVKIDYLTSCLSEQIDFDTRRFVLIQLSEIYEKRKMYLEAGKMMESAAGINTTFQGKINDFLKSFSLFVKSGKLQEADIVFGKAIACSDDKQKYDIKEKRKDCLKQQAEFYLSNDKRKNAMVIYEKLLTLELSPEEKKQVQDDLLSLYEKLGRIKDYYKLKDSTK